MADCALDQLVFQAVPLGEPLAKWPPCLEVQIPPGSAAVPVSATALVAKNYTQGAPLFARHSPIAASDVNWPAYCGLLRDCGILLQASFAEVEALSDVNVPLRMIRRSFDEGFDLVDLSSADTVLIDCSVRVNGRKVSRLPLEIQGWHELKAMTESLRQIVGPGSPIGLNIIAGDVYTDVSNALAARVDYVVLEFTESLHPTTALNHLAWRVTAARTACIQAGQPYFPIYVDAPLTNSEHMVKLLALGASALSVDALLAGSVPASTSTALPVPKGLLSGIGSLPVKATPNIQPLADRLEALLDEIRTRVFKQHLSALSQLNREQLRALDDATARLCAVKLLQHET